MKKNKLNTIKVKYPNPDKKIKSNRKVKKVMKKLKVETENNYNKKIIQKFSLNALKKFFDIDIKNKYEPF